MQTNSVKKAVYFAYFFANMYIFSRKTSIRYYNDINENQDN
jgi:hypothetical protein